jgi:nickel-dependent lactate racemase
MDPKPVTLTYGTEHLDLTVPAAFLAGPVIRPRALPAMDEDAILAAMRGALADPVGRPPLRSMVTGQRVAVVVSDEFRAGQQERIIRVLCEELAAGSPAHVTFLCATGTHEPKVYAMGIGAMVQRWAEAVGLEVDFVAHSCDDPALVDVGTSPLGTPVHIEPAYLRAGVRVYGHESKHHYMNGYSVIDKQVVPGICARATVAANHKRSLSPDSGPGRNPWHSDPARQANPFSEDSQAVRRMVERIALDSEGQLVERQAETFGMDMISDKASIFWVAAGDPDALCATACAKADIQAQFTVPRSRYVIISPGGPPASQAMYGVQNCFDMAMKGAVEPGGEVLVCAPCEGRPDLPAEVRGFATSAKSLELFWNNLVRLRHEPLDEAYRWIDDNFQLYLWKTWRVLRNFGHDELTIHVHSQLPDDALREAGFVPVADPQAWIDERAARADGRLNVIDNGNKLLVIGQE